MSTLIERLLVRDMTLLDGYTPQTATTIGPDTGTTPAVRRELDDMDLDNPMTLYLIISAIQQSQFVEAVPWILDNLLVQSVGSDSYCDPEARLFLQPQLPIEMITFVADSARSRFSLAAVFDSLISLDSTDEIYDACNRAVKVLGDTDYASWVNFANEADFQNNPMVWTFCMQQARRVAPFAPRPSYMQEVTRRTLDEPIPDLTLHVKNKNVNSEDGHSETASEAEEYDKEVASLATRRAMDPELLRVWGPSNVVFNADADDVIDGTADLRMFTDDRFTLEEQGTWFAGSCDKCWLRISSARYAVRKPVEAGGWRGQYCSWDCVRQDCQDFELPSLEMTFFYEKQMNEIGVYDHLFAPPGSMLLGGGEPDEILVPVDGALLR